MAQQRSKMDSSATSTSGVGERRPESPLPWRAAYQLPRGNFHDSQEVFEAISESNSWGSKETLSGPGSEFAATVNLRLWLPTILQRLKLRSMLDAPCGEHHWISDIDLSLESYIGMDIVPELIVRNRQKFESSRKTFSCEDLRVASLPRADLILCRDLLVHLPIADCNQILANFKASGAEFLFTTHYACGGPCEEITTGDWRPIDLTAEPFFFPPPLLTLRDAPLVRGHDDWSKTIALWPFSDIEIHE